MSATVPPAVRVPGHHHYPKPMTSPAGRQPPRPRLRRAWALIAGCAALGVLGAAGASSAAPATGARAPAGAVTSSAAARGAGAFSPDEIVVRYAAAEVAARSALRAGALAAHTVAGVRAVTARAMTLGAGLSAPPAPPATTVPARTRLLRLRAGESVPAALTRLRRERGVLWAVPDFLAHAAGGLIPDDTGKTQSSGTPGGWREVQWNFVGAFGVNAPEAWANLDSAGRPGGKGVTVAVLDTGVAYANRGPFRISPDFARH